MQIAGKGLSVVIPTYNEKENIRVIVPLVLEVFDIHLIDGEIVIVNDAGSDGSEEVLKEFASADDRIKVIYRKHPRSLSSALIEGFGSSGKDYIACIDADLSHDPNYFPEMLRTMEECDLCIGSRYLTERFYLMPGKSFPAAFLSALSQFLTRGLLGFRERDISHSFRLFKKGVFDEIRQDLREEGNVFFIELLYLAKMKGFVFTEVPVDYGGRVYGKTKLRITKEGLRYIAYVIKTFCRRLLSAISREQALRGPGGDPGNAQCKPHNRQGH